MGRGPASVLVDADGNVVGVVQDGQVYRVQVESTIADSDGNVARLDLTGNRKALAVSYPEMLSAIHRMEESLEKINAHLADITGEDDPL